MPVPGAAGFSITMDAPHSVTANFAALAPVTVNTTPAGRSFTVDGTTYTAPQAFQWAPGSSHTIATATQGSGGTQYVFTDVPDELFRTNVFAWPCSAIGKTWHGS